MTLFQDNGVLGDCWDLEKVNIEKNFKNSKILTLIMSMIVHKPVNTLNF